MAGLPSKADASGPTWFERKRPIADFRYWDEAPVVFLIDDTDRAPALGQKQYTCCPIADGSNRQKNGHLPPPQAPGAFCVLSGKSPRTMVMPWVGG
jgi:hypothetical protein